MTTIAEAAKAHNVTKQRILKLIQQGRIPKATRHPGGWHLPADFIILPPTKRNRAPDKITTHAPEIEP